MTLVNTATGELVEPTEDEEARAVAMLGHAISALTAAVDAMPISEVSSLKAQVATIAAATKELNMSKDARDLAAEAVRRAEWALGRAIRKGQAEGTVRRPHDNVRLGQGAVDNSSLELAASPTDFASKDELYGNSAGIMSLAEADEATMDDALGQARAEGNLSRANVVRKVKAHTAPTTRDDRADLIADLAAQGYTSRQMADRAGVTDARVREIARAYSIDIPADKALGKTRRVDSNRIASETVAALHGLAMGIELVDYDDLDTGEMADWADSLTHSLRALNRFSKTIKESTQ